MAASSYSVLYQIGMWVTIISDGISIATQSLLSRYLAQHSEHGNDLARHIIRRSFWIGIVLSSTLVTFLSLFRVPVISFLTKRPDIQAAALEAFPIFMLAQGEYTFLWKIPMDCHCTVSLVLQRRFSINTIVNVTQSIYISCQGIRVSDQWHYHGRNGLGSRHVVHVHRQCGLFSIATSGRT